MSHIIEKSLDNHGEVHEIIVDICGVCHLPVKSEHTLCRKRIGEQERIAADRWRMKQEEKLQQQRLELEKSRPKLPQELLHEKFVAEQIAYEKVAKKERRMQRIAELQEEIKHLTRLVNQDEIDGNV